MIEEKIEEKEDKDKIPSLHELILDTKLDVYKVVPLAARWIEEIREKEEYRHLSTTELIEVALRDILTGKVTLDEIRKLPPIEKKKPTKKYEEKPTKKVK